MPHVLHLLTRAGDQSALAVIARQAQDPMLRVSVVLLPGGWMADVPGAVEVHRLQPTAGDPAPSPGHPGISADRLLELIFLADTVVTW